MNARMAIGLMLLVVESVALAYASGRVVHVVVPVSIAAVIAITGHRIHLTMDRYGYTLGALGILVALWWVLLPPRLNNPLQMFPVAGSSLLYVGALYCVWHQGLQLVVSVRQRYATIAGPFPSFPFVGSFTIAIAGHYTYWATRHAGYTAVVLVFVVLTTFYYLARNGDWMFARYTSALKVFSAVLLVCAVTAGVFTSIAIRENENAINTLLDRFSVANPPESALGFSREGRLTSVTDRRAADDQRPALFVSSERAPGYLRGLVFDTYREARWILPNPNRWLVADESPPPVTPPPGSDRRFFQWTDDEITEPTTRFEIFTTTALLDTVFLPANAAALFVDTESMGMDSADAVRETKPQRRPGYTAIEPAEPSVRPPAADEVARYTLVPAMDSRIERLAAEITAGAETAREKAVAVENYFLKNYEYELGIQVPPGVDPLTYFLLEKPRAHCEYFATGAALLLRLSGVPARYVTGFLAVERNSTGDFFVARNKDAHAWVEAWDPESGWFIVEATPPAGVPEVRDATRWSALRDAISLAWSRFRDRLGADPFDAVVGALAAATNMIVSSIYGKILIGMLVGLVALRFVRRRAFTGNTGAVSDELRRLRALIDRADAVARTAGFTRGDSETVRNFADRVAASGSDSMLNELAQWYREYERVRYRDTGNESAYAFLESALPADR